MVTEIGARDFGDTNRYNMLEVSSLLAAALLTLQNVRVKRQKGLLKKDYMRITSDFFMIT